MHVFYNTLKEFAVADILYAGLALGYGTMRGLLRHVVSPESRLNPLFFQP